MSGAPKGSALLRSVRMKKIRRLLFAAAAVMMIFSAGCADRESASESDGENTGAESEATSPDERKPSLRIADKKVYICQGEEFDLMSGVTGFDNRDGDITDRIVLDKGDFDPDIPGEYTLEYTLSDLAGNAADASRVVVVRDGSVLPEYPVWTESIPGEQPAPEDPKLYGGAWYHKIVSSRDEWLGIEGTVTLPSVSIRRYEGEYDSSLPADPDVNNLDNPSVYLGGNALSESDVGLSFSRALTDVGSGTLSKGCIAFRPFWRYITETDQDAGGYEEHDNEYAVSVNGKNCIANYHWRYTEFYYLPGDTLRIIIYIPEENKMQLQIEVIEKSSDPESVAMREKYGWKDPANFKSPVFSCPGNGTGEGCEYKRVNAIDQSGNEGGTAIATQTEVRDAVWHSTYLYRRINGTLCRVPLTSERRGERNAPDETRFTVTYDAAEASLGGESVTIHPGYANGD